MKRKITSACLFCPDGIKIRSFTFILFLLCCCEAQAQYTYVPDDNFEAALISYDDIPHDNYVPTANISSLTSLDVSSLEIEDLTGIEDFISLTYLDCGDNAIDYLHLDTLTNLEHLNCNTNDLHSLDVSSLTSLVYLAVGVNPYLDELDVSGLTDLEWLDVNATPISELDLTGLIHLEYLWSGANAITTLDLSDQVDLLYLDVDESAITTLDLSNNINLYYLDYSKTDLPSMDFTGLTELITIHCEYTGTTSLDLSDQDHLAIFSCNNNQLTSLDLSANTALQSLRCDDNLLTSLDVSGLSSLESISCTGNAFYTLDFLGLDLDKLYATSNPNLTCIAVDDPTAAAADPDFHKDAGATYWGSPCLVTKVVTADCGTTVASLNTYITADTVIGATSYMFEIIGGTVNTTITRTSNNFKFNQVSSPAIIRYNTTYAIRVKALVGGVWQPYGVACNVSTPEFSPLTQIRTADCGLTLTTLDDDIYCNTVEGVNGYRFKIESSTGTVYVDSSDNKLDFEDLPAYMLEYDQIYTITVATLVGSTYGSYGTACNIYTHDYSPLTRVMDQECNTTLSTISSKIYVKKVTGVEAYKVRVTYGGNTDDIIVMQPTAPAVPFITLTSNLSIVQLKYNAIYTITVATKVLGSYGSFGSACTVTTPTIPPPTKLRPVDCGATLAGLGTSIYATSVPAVDSYVFKVTYNGSDDYYETATNHFTLGQVFGGTGYSRIYTVCVALRVNGVVGDYGDCCTVYTPSMRMAVTNPDTEIAVNDGKIKGYPNPFTNTFALHYDSQKETPVGVSIFDMNGRMLDSFTVKALEMDKLALGEKYASGIYNVVIDEGEERKSLMMIKK